MITEARVTHAKSMWEADNMSKVFATVDGVEEKLFDFYPDELSFRPEDFIGKTLDEGRKLKQQRDQAYLRS